ncbi:unnamed protein product [Laminaria digitata]
MYSCCCWCGWGERWGERWGGDCSGRREMRSRRAKRATFFVCLCRSDGGFERGYPSFVFVFFVVVDRATRASRQGSGIFGEGTCERLRSERARKQKANNSIFFFLPFLFLVACLRRRPCDRCSEMHVGAGAQRRGPRQTDRALSWCVACCQGYIVYR